MHLHDGRVGFRIKKGEPIGYPFKVPVGDQDVHCEDIDAVKAWFALGAEVACKKRDQPAATISSLDAAQPTGALSLKDPAIHVRTLKATSSSPVGFLTPVLAGLVGFTPGLTGPLNNAMSTSVLALGYDPPIVFVVETIAWEKKLWKRGPRIADAIASLNANDARSLQVSQAC